MIYLCIQHMLALMLHSQPTSELEPCTHAEEECVAEN